MGSIAEKIKKIATSISGLITKGNNKMGTSYPDITSVVNNLIGGYKEASWIDLGTGTTFDVKEVCLQYGVDYKSLTKDNFVAVAWSNHSNSSNIGRMWDNVEGFCTSTLYKSYNAESGVLTFYSTITGGMADSNGRHNYGTNLSVHVLLLLAKKATDAGSYVDLGTGQSFDVKPFCEALDIDYKGLTVEDFDLTNASTYNITLAKYISDNYAPSGSTKLVKSYNANTGILTAYINTTISWVHMDGSSKSASVNGNVNARLILAKKVGMSLDDVSIVGNSTRTGSGSASVTIPSINSKVLAVYANGGENGGYPSVTINFTDGTSISANNTTGSYGQTGGYYDKGIMWINNKDYRDKVVSSVSASIGASYSRIICQVAKYS